MAENMELKGSLTATEHDPVPEEVKMPERPQPDRAAPIKREPDTDAKLGKRAEPEPEDDPETSDWIWLMQLVQTNKRAKLEVKESARSIKNMALRLKIRIEPDLSDTEAEEYQK